MILFRNRKFVSFIILCTQKTHNSNDALIANRYVATNSSRSELLKGCWFILYFIICMLLRFLFLINFNIKYFYDDDNFNRFSASLYFYIIIWNYQDCYVAYVVACVGYAHVWISLYLRSNLVTVIANISITNMSTRDQI